MTPGAGLLAGLAVAMALPGAARAWGNDGHRIACRIAEAEMEPATRERALAILARDPTPAYRDFVEACLWGDREGKRGAFETWKHLHYLNAPRDAESVDVGRDCAGPPEGCLLTALAASSRTLLRDDADPDAKLVALKFLIHVAADVHQPLHVSYADDRGGNEFFCRFLGRARWGVDHERRMQLHAVWDSMLIGNALPGGSDWEFLAAELARGIDDEERAAWSDTNPVVWANESFALVRRQVYERDGGEPLRRGDDLSLAYFRRNLPVVKRRLQQAGVRLAALLDRVLAGEAPFALARKGRAARFSPRCPETARIPIRQLEIRPRPDAADFDAHCPRT